MDARERTQETELRRATILFADITGFTSLNENLEISAAYSVVSGALRFLDEIARRHGGTVDKYLGDAVMAMFGIPWAIEETSKAALNAAIEMHNRIDEFSREQNLATPLQIHTGINTGLIISGDVSGPVNREFSVMGDPVNIAARLKDLAPPGQIWVGHETYKHTQNQFDFRPIAELELKGKKKPVRSFELVSREGSSYRSSFRARERASGVLVGRRAELNVLKEALSNLCAGRGSVLGILGEAGLGKSRLVAEGAKSDGSRSTLWLQGRSLSVGSTLGFHTFRDLIRDWAKIPEHESDEETAARLRKALSDLCPNEADEIFPVLLTVLAIPASSDRSSSTGTRAEATENQIVAAMKRLLARISENQPLVLVFEDLHWADVSSLELLKALLRLAEDQRVLFILALRPDFAPATNELMAHARAADSPAYRELRLEALDGTEAGTLIDSLFSQGRLPRATRRLIEERSSGNPFYIEEIVRSLVDSDAVEVRDGALWATDRLEGVEIPDSVQGVIMVRIDGLPLRTRHVLRMASIAGRSSPLALLEGIVQNPDLRADLETLVDRHYLIRSEKAGEETYEFKHPLIQEVAYESLPLDTRQALHVRVAEAIESSSPEPSAASFGLLAYHFSLGGDSEQAERYLNLAGEDATRMSASSEALHLLQQASQMYFRIHGDDADPEKVADLHRKIALAFFARGRMVEGNQHFNRALRLLGQHVATTRVGRNTHIGVTLLTVLADLYLPRRPSRRTPATDRELLIMDMMFHRAQAQVTADPTNFLLDTIDNLGRLCRVDPATVPGAGGLYASTVAGAAYAGFYGAGDRLLRAADSFVDPNDCREVYLYQLMRFIHRTLRGDWSEKYLIEPELTDENIRQGELWNVINYLTLEGRRRIHQGRFSEGKERIERIAKIEDLYAYDLARSNRLALTMFSELEQRRLPEAHRAADNYYNGFDEDLLQLLALSVRAKIEILLNEFDAAEKTLQQARSVVDRTAFVPPFHLSAYHLSRFWLDLIRFEQARGEGSRVTLIQLGRRALQSGRQARKSSHRVAWDRAETHRLLGCLAWRLGRRRMALRNWSQAVHEATELGMRPELGRTYLEIADRLMEAGGADEFEGLTAAACRDRAVGIFEEVGLSEDLVQARRASENELSEE